MTKRNNVEELVGDVKNLSQAEMDKANVKSIRSLNLINFIDLQLQKASCESELKAKVIDKIKNKLDQDQEISITELTYLLTAINKGDNEISLGVLNSIKDFYQIQLEANRGDSGEKDNKSEDGLDSATTKNIKKLIKIFGKFTESEFPEIESKE